MRLLKLHTLAAAHGDGLRQEFLELWTSRQSLDAANVEDIGLHLAEHFMQAGSNPAPDRRITADDGVFIFSNAHATAFEGSNLPAKRRTI